MSSPISTSFNRLSLAGLAATFVGNGIGRFAFIALMPALITAGWFSKSEASYLSVATLAGYLLGAQFCGWFAKRFSTTTLLRASMLACTLSYFACAIGGAGMPWYYFWRTIVGVAGALLMVMAAPVVLPRHSALIWGRVSGVVFSGIGLGAVVSGALVPMLITGIGIGFMFSGVMWPLLVFQGVTGAWLGMGCVCLVFTLLAWRQWPEDAPVEKAALTQDQQPPLQADQRWAVWLILVAYALNAIGYLPHTLFWVDYIVRELHMPLATGGFFWSVFGVGAAIGPLLCGTLADKFGLRPCLVVGFFLKSLGVALPLVSGDWVTLFVSSLLVGVFTPGIVALVSTYTLECVGAVHHRKTWGKMTLSFAAAQAAVGLLMARAAANMESYQPLFFVSACALVASVACVACIRLKPNTTALGPQELTA